MRITAIIALAAALAGCGSVRPASTAGECGVFRDPGRVVSGKTRRDQQDIDARWIEPGVQVCGWPRPKADPAS